MLSLRLIIRKFLIRYVYQDWNIAIADVAEDLSPANIKWMKHDYKDRWFADPFIISENKDTYIILAEECIHDTQKGRLARLTVTKNECRLINNETILELPTHLSFPNPTQVDDKLYIYPENAAGGDTKYYRYGKGLEECGILSELPLADAVIAEIGGSFYLFATIGKRCNGNILEVFKSDSPLSGYSKFTEITFHDNIARRAGNIFKWEDKIISPAQICDADYGEGVSLQTVSMDNGNLVFKEVKRMYPLTKDYPEGFHTYNVFGNKVVIDGYRYGSKLLHNLYFKIRN